MERTETMPAALATPTDRARLFFWIAWPIALLLKLLLSSLGGTMDVSLYAKYGATLAHSDFPTAYASDVIYNIPPLAALYSAFLSNVTGYTGAADFESQRSLFGILLMLPGILAEAVFALVLWRRYATAEGLRRWVPAIFVLNPLTLAITGFHGNFDGLLAVCLGAALLSADAERPIACGLWFAIAANLKVAPVLLGPAFFFWWLARGPRKVVPFTVAAALGVLLGWSPGLLTCPALFLKRVLMYESVWGTWGITKVLNSLGLTIFDGVQYGAPSPEAKYVGTALKLLVISAALVLAWRRRKLAAPGLVETVTAVWTIFFVFAPGGAAQYTIWLLIPLLLWHARLGLWYIVAATPFLVIFYPRAVSSLSPWSPYPMLYDLWEEGMKNPTGWTQPALLLWAFVVFLVVRYGAQWWRERGEIGR